MIKEILTVEIKGRARAGARQQLIDTAGELGFKEFKRGNIGLWVPQDLSDGNLPLHFLAAWGLVMGSRSIGLMEHKIELPITTPHQLVDAAKSLNTLHTLVEGSRGWGGWELFGNNKEFLAAFRRPNGNEASYI